MRSSTKLAIFFMSMFVTMSAMGGSGMGGGILARTGELLKGFPYNRAFLTFNGAPSLLESDELPKLMIPRDEYDFLLNAVQQRDVGGKNPIVLKVDLEGYSRQFELHHMKVSGRGPVFMYLIEQAVEP